MSQIAVTAGESIEPDMTLSSVEWREGYEREAVRELERYLACRGRIDILDTRFSRRAERPGSGLPWYHLYQLQVLWRPL